MIKEERPSLLLRLRYRYNWIDRLCCRVIDNWTDALLRLLALVVVILLCLLTYQLFT